ncbi:peptidoglycan-binding domain-containing protein [Nioella nitratireducens]|uniref:peptidoglycan-binding domain-containing protein n=1 Tax=Nioella nitratireducens TaxID=1287720 RepID=UPI0008FD3CC3|nr:peptidoglycan-binding domain-containing protein [Nioella nitratireducens]
MKVSLPLLAGLMGLAACGAGPGAEVARLMERDGTIISRGEGPEDARPDACYARDQTPAVIETVTEQVMVQPPQLASDGAVREPAIFRTETRQRIVQERQEVWFETPCQSETDPAFIASVQRALAARGIYQGPVNGVMDRPTRRAIRQFQDPQGLDSGVLSLAAARLLGLAVWDPVAAARPDYAASEE